MSYRFLLQEIARKKCASNGRADLHLTGSSPKPPSVQNRHYYVSDQCRGDVLRSESVCIAGNR